VYEGGTDRIRSEPIPQVILGLIYLLILTRFIWPLQLPLSIKIVAGALALVALQFHRWSKLSSGSGRAAVGLHPKQFLEIDRLALGLQLFRTFLGGVHQRL
jgi:hypothetical protein